MSFRCLLIRLLSLTWSHLFSFALVAGALGVLSSKSCPTPESCLECCLCTSCQQLHTLGLQCGSLVYPEWVFVCGERRAWSFVPLHLCIQFYQHCSLQRLSWLHRYGLSTFCQRSVCCVYEDSFLGCLFCSTDLWIRLYASTKEL